MRARAKMAADGATRVCARRMVPKVPLALNIMPMALAPPPERAPMLLIFRVPLRRACRAWGAPSLSVEAVARPGTQKEEICQGGRADSEGHACALEPKWPRTVQRVSVPAAWCLKCPSH